MPGRPMASILEAEFLLVERQLGLEAGGQGVGPAEPMPLPLEEPQVAGVLAAARASRMRSACAGGTTASSVPCKRSTDPAMSAARVTGDRST